MIMMIGLDKGAKMRPVGLAFHYRLRFVVTTYLYKGKYGRISFRPGDHRWEGSVRASKVPYDGFSLDQYFLVYGSKNRHCGLASSINASFRVRLKSFTSFSYSIACVTSENRW